VLVEVAEGLGLMVVGETEVVVGEAVDGVAALVFYGDVDEDELGAGPEGGGWRGCLGAKMQGEEKRGQEDEVGAHASGDRVAQEIESIVNALTGVSVYSG
jgi:hypothetical protein